MQQIKNGFLGIGVLVFGVAVNLASSTYLQAQQASPQATLSIIKCGESKIKMDLEKKSDIYEAFEVVYTPEAQKDGFHFFNQTQGALKGGYVEYAFSHIPAETGYIPLPQDIITNGLVYMPCYQEYVKHIVLEAKAYVKELISNSTGECIQKDPLIQQVLISVRVFSCTDMATITSSSDFPLSTSSLLSASVSVRRKEGGLRISASQSQPRAASNTPPFSPNRGTEMTPWGVYALDADLAHQAGITGKGIPVAVVDTGVGPHEDIDVHEGIGINLDRVHRYFDKGILVSSSGNAFLPFVFWPKLDPSDRYVLSSGPANYSDIYYHGTHVAGTIAAKANGKGVVGVAPDVDLYAARVFYPIEYTDENGHKVQDIASDTSLISQGIDWAIGKAKVINLSLGWPDNTYLIKDLIQAAHDQGVLIVAAAGNDGLCAALGNSLTDPICTGNAWYPALYQAEGVLSVTALDSLLKEDIFSSSTFKVKQSIGAPGSYILSTLPDNTYGFLFGTSMATPHVVGLAALVFSKYPNLSAGEVRDRITQKGIQTPVNRPNVVNAFFALDLSSQAGEVSLPLRSAFLPVEFSSLALQGISTRNKTEQDIPKQIRLARNILASILYASWYQPALFSRKFNTLVDQKPSDWVKEVQFNLLSIREQVERNPSLAIGGSLLEFNAQLIGATFEDKEIFYQALPIVSKAYWDWVEKGQAKSLQASLSDMELSVLGVLTPETMDRILTSNGLLGVVDFATLTQTSTDPQVGVALLFGGCNATDVPGLIGCLPAYEALIRKVSEAVPTDQDLIHTFNLGQNSSLSSSQLSLSATNPPTYIFGVREADMDGLGHSSGVKVTARVSRATDVLGYQGGTSASAGCGLLPSSSCGTLGDPVQPKGGALFFSNALYLSFLTEIRSGIGGPIQESIGVGEKSFFRFYPSLNQRTGWSASAIALQGPWVVSISVSDAYATSQQDLEGDFGGNLQSILSQSLIRMLSKATASTP